MYSAYTPFPLLNKILNPDEIVHGTLWISRRQKQKSSWPNLEQKNSKFRAFSNRQKIKNTQYILFTVMKIIPFLTFWCQRFLISINEQHHMKEPLNSFNYNGHMPENHLQITCCQWNLINSTPWSTLLDSFPFQWSHTKLLLAYKLKLH